MAKVIFEILHPLRQREHHVFDKNVVSIGRGYDNDIIITDPHVSANHARVSLTENGWVAEDLQSENGLFVPKLKMLVKETLLNSGDGFIIGKTRIRLLTADHPVLPAVPFVPRNPLLKILNHPVVAWFIILLMMVLYAFMAHLSSSENLALEKLLTGALGMLLIAVVWASIWAFVGRLIKHKARFFLQLSVSALFLSLLVPANEMSGFAGYLYSSAMLENILFGALAGILFVAFLSRNLAIATNTTIVQQRVVSCVIYTVMAAFAFILYYTYMNEFNPQPNYYATLRPPVIDLPKTLTPREFFDKGKHVFQIDLSKNK